MSNNGGLDLVELGRRWPRSGRDRVADNDDPQADYRLELLAAWADIQLLLTVARTVHEHHHAQWAPVAQLEDHTIHVAVCSLDGKTWPCPDAALFRE